MARSGASVNEGDGQSKAEIPAALGEQFDEAWGVVRAIEPAAGRVSDDAIGRVRDALRALDEARGAASLAEVDDDDRIAMENAMAILYARAAAVATAAGDAASAAGWFAIAEALVHVQEVRDELAAGRAAPERYRALVHGRYLAAHEDDKQARQIWRGLRRGDDALARAAAEALAEPPSLRHGDSLPSLWRINGCGLGMYGSRDGRRDGSYVATHCVSFFFLPVLPLSAWRVRVTTGGFEVLSRAKLSRFARLARLAIPMLVVLGIAFAAVLSVLRDPKRLAAQRWDAALVAAQTSDREAALRGLDRALAEDRALVDGPRIERAGAEVVRLSAAYVASPFTVAHVDEALRVVHRYRALPEEARDGVARDAMLDAIDGWVRALGEAPATAEARLSLLAAGADLAQLRRRTALLDRAAEVRRGLAVARQDDAPIDALDLLLASGAPLTPAVVEAATPIVTKLVATSPSLLLDLGPTLDAWLAAAPPEAAQRVTAARKAAEDARAAATAEGVTPAQLAQLAVQSPWDQYAALQLAQLDAGAGKAAAAIARLTKLGAPGWMIRSARLALAQLAAGEGRLVDADALLASLLGARLVRFTAAVARVEAANKAVRARMSQDLRVGNVSDAVRRDYDAATNDAERDAVITRWGDGEIDRDTALRAARADALAVADVVPAAIAAGSVKLRRAQAMTGTDREAMLRDAERTFLSIQVAAEGDPSYELALGEIQARLGNAKASDAAFQRVRDRHEPVLDLRLAYVHRALGSVARAKQIARDVYAAATQDDIKQAAASLLGVLSENDEEAEPWYRKADPRDRSTRSSLLEIEGRRLLRQGNVAGCAQKFSASAALQLEVARVNPATGYNNAAVAHGQAYACSGDPQQLRSAATDLEAAYLNAPDNAVVASNLSDLRRSLGDVQLLGRRVDVRALRLDLETVEGLVSKLMWTSERDAVRAEAAAERNYLRSEEVLAQFEVLAPNNPRAYRMRFELAVRNHDATVAAAVVARARRAPAIDSSALRESRERWIAGQGDATLFESIESSRRQLEATLARSDLSPRTRAAGLYALSWKLRTYGVYRADRAAVVQAREHAERAMQLWPAIDTRSAQVDLLIDEAGIAADAKAWVAARRLRNAVPALARLVAEHSPLADAIRRSPQWTAALAVARQRVMAPDLEDYVFAQLAGDPALARDAAPALDEPLAHAGAELNVVLDPSDALAKEPLASYARR